MFPEGNGSVIAHGIYNGDGGHIQPLAAQLLAAMLETLLNRNADASDPCACLPADIEQPLRVVSTLRTVITSIRHWPAGETIGYGRRGVLTRPSRIATIPIGYADGINRHFGRGAISVMVNGKEAPTVGNICMDACMIDVTDIDCKVGDSVEIFGPNAPLQRLADVLDTIPYEVLTSISPRVKRIYYRE